MFARSRSLLTASMIPFAFGCAACSDSASSTGSTGASTASAKATSGVTAAATVTAASAAAPPSAAPTGAADAGGGKADIKMKIVASCDNTTGLGACDDYAADDAAVRDPCKASGAKWEKKPCPTDKLLGSCARPGDITRFYAVKQNMMKDEKAAEAACKSMQGEFFAPTK